MGPQLRQRGAPRPGVVGLGRRRLSHLALAFNTYIKRQEVSGVRPKLFPCRSFSWAWAKVVVKVEPLAPLV